MGTEQQTPPAKKLPRGKPFPKGVSGNPSGKPAPERPKLAVTSADILADFDRAYKQPPAKDDPPGVKAARKLFHDDYKLFVAEYNKVRLAALKEREPTTVVGPAEAGADPKRDLDPDENEVKVEDLIEQLLAEWEEAGE